MDKRILFAIVLLAIPILFCSLGAIDGYTLVVPTLEGRFIRWEQLPTPPMQAIEIIGIKNVQNKGKPLIYVRSSNQQIFGANLDECFSPRKLCWEEVSQMESAMTILFCQYDVHISDPPENVVQRIDVCNHFANGASPSEVYTSAVLLSDGSLWIWRYEYWELDNLKIFVYPLDYGFRGFIWGLAASMLLLLTKFLSVRAGQNKTE